MESEKKRCYRRGSEKGLLGDMILAVRVGWSECIRHCSSVPTVSSLLDSCATYGDESIHKDPADWPSLSMTKAELLPELSQPMRSTGTTLAGGTREIMTWTYSSMKSNPALFI